MRGTSRHSQFGHRLAASLHIPKEQLSFDLTTRRDWALRALAMVATLRDCLFLTDFSFLAVRRDVRTDQKKEKKQKKRVTQLERVSESAQKVESNH